VGELLPALRGFSHLQVHPFGLKKALDACNLLFLALPHGASMKIVPEILRRPDARVVDLSADFRLRSVQRFQNPSLLKQAVYGLPEWNRKEIPSARLVANPGCYPTATLLGLAPLAKAGLLKGQGLIVDAKSGVTGAGRSVKEELLFSEVNEDLRAYRVNTHQHIPEMEQELGRLARRTIRMTFVPHLVPLNRGLYATLYAPLTRRLTDRQLRAVYEESYEGEPFIRLLPEGAWPHVASVAGTNQCEIGLKADPKRQSAIVISAIDNLGKGAAGQAVQNMNLLYGLEETAGLV
jgi:N-acetyl-gamma-glutamyl-phosphate reductase